MNVLSLFDGISCGQIALSRAGFSPELYFASEIDKAAIQVTQHNYPKTHQLGDVKNVTGNSLPPVSLLIGGSPCQGFSSLGKNLNFNDHRSALFFEYVRLLDETKPSYFLLENVPMKKQFRDVISGYLGVEPIMINSNLVSAQNRKRLYWTNIPVNGLPLDRNIFLDMVIDHTYSNYTMPKNWKNYVPSNCPRYVDPYHKKEIRDKSTTLRTNVNTGNMWVRVPNGYRNLSRHETEELQTVPLGYTSPISEHKAKKCLGNGWTVDVISHIFSGIQKVNIKN